MPADTATAPDRTDLDAVPDGDLIRHLAGLHLDHFDLEVLGLHVVADGIVLDLDTAPSDEARLTTVLTGAMGLLHRLRSAARMALEPPVEGVRRWLIAKLLHLVRVMAGRLIKLVAARLGEHAAAKAGAKHARRSGETKGKKATPKAGTGSGATGGATRSASTSRGAARSGGRAPRVPTPDQARAAVQKMPSTHVKRLAQGVDPDEVKSVVAAQPPAQREQVRASIVRLQQAAEEEVHAG